MSTYKHGSSAFAHENENLTLPNMRWLGVRSSDMIGNIDSNQGQGLLRLTSRDRKMATRMLDKDVFREDSEPEWRRELQTMLMLNVKAEIQFMSNEQSLEKYLDTQLRNR